MIERDLRRLKVKNYTVEIDEAKFGKRKYNRGRIVEGQRILGVYYVERLENVF